MPPHNVEPSNNGNLDSSVNVTPVNTELLMVTGYTDIAKLAHTPTGEEGSGVYSFHLNVQNGK
eukprot:CAMPEP_0196740384 /NCGR_PEP_ID=MMETSP1091-20130531/31396_1 /TAXON_ID=302021 /ORGANISM="Rhodomonas sp., Strain CCMP768" /LENGTH=62 /DNA_ID=CAMNT_0042085505 /DNA_START=78 /DNA_END=263 /DNA_ORIENTATION=+